MSYIVKVKKISVVNEVGDRVVVINCYILDSAGTAIKSIDGGEIGFDIRAPKSAPLSDPILTNYLPDLAKDQIKKKYNRYLTVTTTPTHGSNKLLFNASDIDKLFTGLTVTGPGITSATTLTSITTPTEIQLSSNLTLQLTGSTTSPSLTPTGTTTLDSAIITLMSSTTGIVGGMFVSGTGIPYGSTVLSVNSASSITLTQKATASNSGVTFTITTVADSIYLTTVIALFTSTVYEGLTISGTSIPRNTTIDEVINSTKVKLTNNATGASTSTRTISGSPVYYFDTSNIVFDTSELSNISDLPLINFDQL